MSQVESKTKVQILAFLYPPYLCLAIASMDRKIRIGQGLIRLPWVSPDSTRIFDYACYLEATAPPLCYGLFCVFLWANTIVFGSL
jgi:hypothetical protein